MKRWAADTQRTGQPRCMHREDSAIQWFHWSSGSVSIAGLRVRTYAIDLPASPIPGTITITLTT